MKKTPLSAEHERLSARMVDFSGWHLPVQYEGIFTEHAAVREACGLFDTCHMGRILAKGHWAPSFLSRTTTVDAENMPVGRCRYGFILNEAAGILDDLIIYRLCEDEFMVVVNAATRESDIKHLSAFLPDAASLDDISAKTAKIDIQGPMSTAVMKDATGIDLTALKYFCLETIAFGTEKAIVSRTGYTGETGYEIYLPSELAVEFWNKAMKAGATACGLGARDTLRLEAGLPLYGHEMTEERTPAEAGFMRYIDLSRDFIGAPALRQNSKPLLCLMPFRIDGRQSARNGNKVIVNSQEAGWVTSGSFAPSLGHSIGFAYVDSKSLAGSDSFGIDNGRKILEAFVTQAPFYTNKRKAAQ